MFDFIVANLPVVICVIAGIGLLILEMFMPGFGIPGVSGILLLIAGAVLVWIRAGALAGLGMIIVTVALVAIALSIALRSAANGRISRSDLILNAQEKREEGFVSAQDMGVLVGRVGEAQTVLRPSGIADFDGVRMNVVTDGVFIRQGEKVRIVRTEGSRVVVERSEPERT